MIIPEEIREKLKKPLGSIHTDYDALKKAARGCRIISVGDICTLGLLAAGVRPHLAVFDFRSIRKPLKGADVSKLKSEFGRMRRMKNPAGTLSERIIERAAELAEKGGALLIDGEEDLTALAFIANAGPRDLILYGQPGEGFVLVKPDRKTKNRARALISAAAALGHEVKRSEYR